MATRIQKLVRAVSFLLFCSAAIVRSATFPTPDEFKVSYYTTEVQITDVLQAATAHVKEYCNTEDVQGAVKVYFKGNVMSVYYDNSTYQITTVSDNGCHVWDEDISDYYYYGLYFGWLNHDPLVLGPSAALWYAQAHRNEIVEKTQEEIRNIPCDKFELPVVNEYDNITITYYFAPEDWATPYKYENLRVPIRIHITGESSRYSADHAQSTPVEQINDFAYFKPTIDDLNNLLPPVGIGCPLKKETEDFPEIPTQFQYTAQVVNLLTMSDRDDFEVQYQQTWYDQEALLARLDTYSKQKGRKSALYDFNTGVVFNIQNDGTCRMLPLRDAEFETVDYAMTSRMMTPKEALNLEGTFYDMGEREIRGIECDTFESIDDEHAQFNNKDVEELVVTAYFTKSSGNVGVKGTTESRIPVHLLITGYNTTGGKSLQLDYSIFEFDSEIYPPMYSSFRLDRCFTKASSKASFVLIMNNVPADVAAKMEGQDEIVTRQLRTTIAIHAKVPEMRIPYLKVDYKPTGVYVKGVMVDRPPALLQFFDFNSGDITTYDPDVKAIVEAKTLEECAYSCVDEGSFPCKGFYFCNQACFLKSIDPFEQGDGKEVHLGECRHYIRDEIDSTNTQQAYLNDALKNLETTVLKGQVTVMFEIKGGSETVNVTDVVIGDGPYIGVDVVDAPYTISVEDRKLDVNLLSVKPVQYAGTLHECYKQCNELGDQCSSFSFCPDYDDRDDKECLVTSDLIIKDRTKDSYLVPDKSCNIYNMKYLEYFIAYPEKVSLLSGEKVISNVESVEMCAKNCRLETNFTCRGFEFCKSRKFCTLHTKHILNLRPGEAGIGSGRACTHYAARYIADYSDYGPLLVDDTGDKRDGTTLEECAKLCSEEQKENCNSFNFCPLDDSAQGSCSLSKKSLKDDEVPTTVIEKCLHYEKRDEVNDWKKSKKPVSKPLSTSGWTKKGFTGLVIGMLVFGLLVGAVGFVVYSFIRSRSGSSDSTAVRFMKSDS